MTMIGIIPTHGFCVCAVKVRAQIVPDAIPKINKSSLRF
jgi:hypothetical protein